MLKKLTYLLIIIMVSTSVLVAQESHTIDFEVDGTGADWDWEVAENADNPAIEIIDNPDPTGANTSAKVAKFIARANGNPWALIFTTSDGEFTFDANNSMVKIMVHKPRTSTVAIKFEGGTGQPIEIPNENTVTGEWQELTYDFSGLIGSTYAKMVIIPDNGDARTGDYEMYIDNIVVPDGVILDLAEPTTAAATPTDDAENVMSVFSDAYTDIEGTDFNPQWGQGTEVSFETIGEDNVMKYSFLNYQGTGFASALDLTGMDYMHVDFWTPNASFLQMFLISANSGEQKFDFTIETEQWVSVDIPLSHFTDLGMSIADVIQLKVEGTGTVYFDNIYFKKESTGMKYVGNDNSMFTLDQNYPNPFNENTQIRFNLKESNHVLLKVYDSFGQEVAILKDELMTPGYHEVTLDANMLSSGNYFISLTAGELTSTRTISLTK